MKNRNGSYKKVLIERCDLEPHRKFLAQNIAALKSHSLTPHSFCSLYILLFLRLKHPLNWLQKKSRKTPSANLKSSGELLLNIIPESFQLSDWEKEKLKDVTTYSLFSEFNLRGIPQSIHRAMLNWLNGTWNIILLEFIPSPRQLLKQQAQNKRCITVITAQDQLTSLVLDSRDPLSFVLHDLMHADQFFSQEVSLKGQLGFYYLLDLVYDQPLLSDCLKSDPQFKKEFEYVASDMNAYVVHSLKCLKSACYRTNSPEIFTQITSWWKMDETEKESAHKINTPQFQLSDEMRLKNFFEHNQEIMA